MKIFFAFSIVFVLIGLGFHYLLRRQKQISASQDLRSLFQQSAAGPPERGRFRLFSKTKSVEADKVVLKLTEGLISGQFMSGEIRKSLEGIKKELTVDHQRTLLTAWAMAQQEHPQEKKEHEATRAVLEDFFGDFVSD